MQPSGNILAVVRSLHQFEELLVLANPGPLGPANRLETYLDVIIRVTCSASQKNYGGKKKMPRIKL
jgi:hypothetical protein